MLVDADTREELIDAYGPRPQPASGLLDELSTEEQITAHSILSTVLYNAQRTVTQNTGLIEMMNAADRAVGWHKPDLLPCPRCRWELPTHPEGSDFYSNLEKHLAYSCASTDNGDEEF